jgi:hypothetical protein
MLDRVEILAKLAAATALVDRLTAELGDCQALCAKIEQWCAEGRELRNEVVTWVNRQVEVAEENDATIEALRQRVDDSDPSEAWKNA